LKNVLGEIYANRGNLHIVAPIPAVITTALWRIRRPGVGAIHTIRFQDRLESGECLHWRRRADIQVLSSGPILRAIASRSWNATLGVLRTSVLDRNYELEFIDRRLPESWCNNFTSTVQECGLAK
ncbi:MAG: hypothetical protein AB3N20_05705, partial [Rhizobiaceae bacterium]